MDQTNNPTEFLLQDGQLAGELVDQLRGGRVLIVGDTMLDHYLYGTVERISPEAPVPVVGVRSEKYVLGGAGNVAKNIASLGGEPHLLSYRGSDAAGEQLEGILVAESISHELLTIQDRPTTIKTRIIAHNQQVCRVDTEKVDFLLSVYVDQLCQKLESLVSEYAVLILSDYGKGLIQADFMQRLFSLRERLNPEMKILVDPKTRNAHLYTGVSLLTPNSQEAAECGQCAPLHDMSSTLHCAGEIFKRLGNQSLLITLGSEGMVLFDEPGHALHIPTVAKKVFDVTGAGDTVIAVLGLGLSQGLALLPSALLANTAAGIVVGQIGAASVSPGQLQEAIFEHGAVSVEVLK